MRTPSNSVRSVRDVLEGEVLDAAPAARRGAATAGCSSSALISEPKRKRPSTLRVVERLDPEAVAGEEELALALVPDREREHAVEALDAGRAPLLVGVQRRPRCRSASGSGGRAPRARRAARGSCRARRCRRARTCRPRSAIGWWPAGERSMIARRRFASPTPRSTYSRVVGAAVGDRVAHRAGAPGGDRAAARVEMPAIPHIRRTARTSRAAPASGAGGASWRLRLSSHGRRARSPESSARRPRSPRPRARSGSLRMCASC